MSQVTLPFDFEIEMAIAAAVKDFVSEAIG